MKVTRVHIEHAGVVVCLATSSSVERVWDGMHHMLRSRGKRTRSAAIDLLFVVADSRDPHWYRATAPLCREAKLAIVQGVAYPDLGAEQFAQGITTYWTWMVRFFDVVVTTIEQPGTVLRALLDFLSRGLVGTDFADLMALLHQAGNCEVHRRTFSADTPIDGVRRLIEGDKDLVRTLRSANRIVCVVRANPISAEMLDTLDLMGSDQTMVVINVVWAHDSDALDIVFLSSPEPSDVPQRGDRAIPSADDLAALDSAYDCREATHRSRSESHDTGLATSSSELSPQLANFDPVDVPHLMVVAQFATGRNLLRNNPALGLVLARWELCCRSRERVLWWELQEEMKVSSETMRVIAESLASGPAAMLAAAMFPIDARLQAVLEIIPAHLVRMTHLLSIRRIFLDASAAAVHCRDLLAACPPDREDILRLAIDIQLAKFVSAECLREFESPEIAPVRHHIDAHELVREAAGHLGFKLPGSTLKAASGPFRRVEDVFACAKPGCMIASGEPLPERSAAFNRLCDVDALVAEWEVMSNHYLGMFVLRDGWDDSNHAFYCMLAPMRATAHFMKVDAAWWLIEAKGQDGCNIDFPVMQVIAAQFSGQLNGGPLQLSRS